MTIDWKKTDMALYLPGTDPVRVEVPEMRFFAISGSGSPDRPEFGEEIGALYSAAYTVRFWTKKEKAPPGWFDCAVFPLEGVWDVAEMARGRFDAQGHPTFDRETLVYEIMIRQPDFVTEDFAAQVLERAAAKIPEGVRGRVRLVRATEGACVQMTHVGPYATEPESFARIAAYCASGGLERESLVHREIYMSDPRRVVPEKQRTVLRVRVRPMN
jgi:hypothetical protein